MHQSHIPQCTNQNRNVYIPVLNGALWDMEQLWDLWDWSITYHWYDTTVWGQCDGYWWLGAYSSPGPVQLSWWRRSVAALQRSLSLWFARTKFINSSPASGPNYVCGICSVSWFLASGILTVKLHRTTPGVWLTVWVNSLMPSDAYYASVS